MRLVRTAELETVRTTPRKLPERLLFPIKPGEPDWGKIGWEHFENLDVNKLIWERWAPPMRNTLTEGVKRKVCEECYSGENRITPLLNPLACLENHTQYICGTCGRCICIEHDPSR